MFSHPPKNLLAFFLHFLPKRWLILIMIQLLCLCWAIDQTIWPYLVKLFIDTLNTQLHHSNTLTPQLIKLIIFSLLLWISVDLGFRISGILMARFFPSLEADVRLAMFNYLQQHSQRYFADQLAGSLANKVSDMTQSMTALLQQILTIFIPGFVTMLIAIGLFIHVEPTFALILSAWLLIHFTVCFIGARFCNLRSHTHAEARSTLAGKLVDSLTNMSTVRAFARQRFELHDLSNYQADERHKNQAMFMTIEKVKIALSISAILGSLIGLNGYALYACLHQQISLGSLIFIINTNWNVNMTAWFIGLQLPNFFKDIGICQQALEPIQVPHEIVDAINAKPLQVTRGEIVFNQVHFNYDNYHLFEDKTVTIPAGKKIGLVGFSGSGKTSFVNLIMRYFAVQSGAIFIDNQNIAEVTQDSLHQHIALIPQEPALFHRSLLDNIRYGKLDATDDEIIAAAQAAHCHEFIMALPQQYATLVGERGIKLSGGQRQRIAIARAILKNAPILILDEATSALDSVTEKYIQDSLQQLMENCTTIVIAHRLSTLSYMDELLVFSAGKIIEQGTHQTLLARKGHYAMLWHKQARGFLPEH